MMRLFSFLLTFSTIIHIIFAHVETLHFESACLQQSNSVQLNLRCGQYEHIQIIRVIYGYTKQPVLNECQFSIYDCIQEGTSSNVLSCNDKQTCVINLSKTEMLSSAVATSGVPTCPDFNYIQVNFGCIPDSKDICDRWKEEGPVVHISHTYSKNRPYNRCHCKVRSSMVNGQVLLHAREINRQYANLKSLLFPKVSNTDCKKTTYLEIATDRSERKCMDMLPSTNVALFGSGSHNFSLTYVKSDLFSELFFYFELKASPIKKDHNVQIICNWKRRTTTTITTTLETTTVMSTTIPVTKRRKGTTVGMQSGGKLSRIDLMQHRPLINQQNHDDFVDTEESINVSTSIDDDLPQDDIDIETKEANEDGEIEEEEEEEEIITTTTTMPLKTSRRKKSKTRKTTLAIETTKSMTTVSDDDEWERIISLTNADIEPPSKQLISINNRTFVTVPQASVVNFDDKNRHSSSSSSLLKTSNTLLIILLVIICLTVLMLIIYCFKVKRPDCIQRLRTNANIALLFCCEAGKLLFCSPDNSRSVSNTPTTTIGYRSTRRRRHHRQQNQPSICAPDYQSSEYYIDDVANNCQTTQSIYDGGGKSIYSIDYDEEDTAYTTKYDRHNDAGSC